MLRLLLQLPKWSFGIWLLERISKYRRTQKLTCPWEQNQYTWSLFKGSRVTVAGGRVAWWGVLSALDVLGKLRRAFGVRGGSTGSLSPVNVHTWKGSLNLPGSSPGLLNLERPELTAVLGLSQSETFFICIGSATSTSRFSVASTVLESGMEVVRHNLWPWAAHSPLLRGFLMLHISNYD